MTFKEYPERIKDNRTEKNIYLAMRTKMFLIFI